ncbi:TPA: TrbI/VirB10 family protein [Raoultella ornithinolytica]|uniref:VirB10/TraB/TrbI family type IV secretion system protein n=1 Tax=Raoultella ornithinolytica TaxID=54291 RepID=UPI00273F6BA9|nr:VirB10/TraB/TrbI family type IV secretion system protein [Raoultella ornithinolytica]WLP48147.1 VirB10/TraB/TrbI family type IV secretion system protein [Raoultella ornithinolytica]HEC2551421.1 TrbI/VirB10 family protein [Raoultella ornithinolytica]HEC2604044.1 TrbI/VirB10 family protein [Raoultella ornithinolytica]HEC2610513.1 TrbI/VirB10 family protein [Raoultella ornithinolytica]
MTDKPVPDEPEKTTAEREAEARERARAAMAYHEPEQRTSPGQPEVTRFRKVSGRRTLIVSLLSLALVIALAFGGDRLFSALKGGNEKEADTAPPPSAEKTLHERQNLGMDSNPFGLFGPHIQDRTAPVSQTVTPAPSLPPTPPALNKAAALADGPNNTRTMPADNVRTSPDEPRSNAETSDSRSSSTTYTSCTSVLTRGKDGSLRCPETAAPETGNNDNPGVARVTGVRRLDLDPDLYIPVDRYIPCSMMWRFVSDVGGHISCLISEDVYSASNHVTLIPAGTVTRGIYRTGALQHGRSRMFVLWTELRTPEPGSLQIPLTDTQASGPLGEAGISGWIDNHFWERFGNALMLSTVQDVAAAASDAAPGKDRNTDYTENTRAATAEMAKTTLDNSINIPPTLYLNQGDVIGIMTGTDIDFSSVWQLRLKKRLYER